MYLGDERDDLGSERDVEVCGGEGVEVIVGRDVVRFSEEEGRDGVRGKGMAVVQRVFEVKLHGRVCVCGREVQSGLKGGEET